MSTQVEIESIEALDFEYTPPCEHSDHANDSVHGGPAAVLATTAACACSESKSIYLCEGFWDWVSHDYGTLYCVCGEYWPSARQAYLSARSIGRH